MNISARFWNIMASNYGENNEGIQHVQSRVIEITKEYLTASDRVLDYGCATGGIGFEFAGLVSEIQGIDFASKMVAEARRNAVERNIVNIQFTQSTIFDKRLQADAYDVILAFGILHLLKNPGKVIQRINELLKPGGWFLSSTACMGGNNTIPTMINRILFIPSRIGIIPFLRFMNIAELEAAIHHVEFEIVERETLSFTAEPPNDRSYIVAHFVAAKKMMGNTGEHA